MKWVTTGPSGVFAIPLTELVHFLENSEGVINPTINILENPTWTQAIVSFLLVNKNMLDISAIACILRQFCVDF